MAAVSKPPPFPCEAHMLGFIWDEIQIWRLNRWARRYEEEQRQKERKTIEPPLPPRAVRHPKPPALSTDLLIGKSSNGMYFEPGRCVHCGQALNSKVEFEFCSEACKEKAIRPFLGDPQSPIEEDPVGRHHIESLDFIRRLDPDEYKQLARKEGGPSQREDFLAKLQQKLDARKTLLGQREHDAEITALNEYQEKWVKQRAYVLARETEKQNEKQTKENEKLSLQQTKDRAKQDALDAEEAKWRPKKFEL